MKRILRYLVLVFCLLIPSLAPAAWVNQLGNRSYGTTYQNTSGLNRKVMFTYWSPLGSAGGYTVYMSPSLPVTTTDFKSQFKTDLLSAFNGVHSFPGSFVVPSNWYYMIADESPSGTATIYNWGEWDNGSSTTTWVNMVGSRSLDADYQNTTNCTRKVMLSIRPPTGFPSGSGFSWFLNDTNIPCVACTNFYNTNWSDLPQEATRNAYFEVPPGWWMRVNDEATNPPTSTIYSWAEWNDCG